MRRVLLIGVFLLGCKTSSPLPSPSIGSPCPLTGKTDNALYLPLDYGTFLPPPVGESYDDPVFGTAIERMSDALHTADAALGTGNLHFIVNEYSTMVPFNRDSSKILIQHQSYFALYDEKGKYLKDLPFEINASSEPRWSRSDPNVLYFRENNALKRYDLLENAVSTVRAFPEYSVISGKGESDISFDGDHFVFIGDDYDIFVYEISTDRKGPALPVAGLGGIDQLYLTPDNHVLVGWYAVGAGRYRGIEMYDKNMNFIRQVAPAEGHMDVARDVDGEEVLLWINAADPNPVAPNAIVKIRLSTGEQTPLILFDWSLAVHISAPDQGDWFFVGTYAVSDPLPGTLGWTTETNELLQVRMDGTQVRRLAHHRSRPFNSYYWTPRASTNREGNRLVFSSNQGLQNILGYPPDYSDVYLISLCSQ